MEIIKTGLSSFLAFRFSRSILFFLRTEIFENRHLENQVFEPKHLINMMLVTVITNYDKQTCRILGWTLSFLDTVFSHNYALIFDKGKILTGNWPESQENIKQK